MKHIHNDKFQESYVEETLDNGLKVVVWQKPEFSNSQFILATPYGALDFNQKSAEKLYSFPSGIAHFLEHKMFEMNGLDVMEAFSNLGANVNAFTSYNETMYYFSSSNKDLNKEINLLLDFVQELFITEESVEKEKGIIVQELNMYLQMPDTRLLFETFKSLFHTHPLSNDIGGDEESVMNTTLDDLVNCHRLNYHPSKMILFATTALEPKYVIDVISENQKNKSFGEYTEVNRISSDEPQTVCRELHTLEMDITNEKTSIAYKLPVCKLDTKERLKLEWCFKFLLEIHFSTLNPNYQSWLDSGIINEFFGFEIDLGKDYGFILFYSETTEAEFSKFITSELDVLMKNVVNEKTIEQIKRRLYGSGMRMFNGIDRIGFSYIRCYFNGLDVFESLELIDDITVDDVLKAKDMLDLTNKCITVIKPH